MRRAIGGAVSDTYFELIQKFPLRSIRSERELDAAQAILNDLLRRRLDSSGRQYLDALTDLIEIYEDKAHQIPDSSESDVLRLLMDSNGLSQSALSGKVGIAQSTISAVLSGERTLTKEQILALANFFRISPMAFLPAN
jgi:HTH-type transcriptional regulator/antitoxin HigA